MPLEAFDQPLLVSVLGGEVLITGSQGPTAIVLTAPAAAETAKRLAEAALQAQVELARGMDE